jgi:hypothetical protein
MPAARMPASSWNRSSAVGEGSSSNGRTDTSWWSCPQRPSPRDRRAAWRRSQAPRRCAAPLPMNYPVRVRNGGKGGAEVVWFCAPLVAGLADPSGVRAAMAARAESLGLTMNGERHRSPPVSVHSRLRDLRENALWSDGP